MEATLKAEKREGRGKEAARRLRSAGRVPAILYGKGSGGVSLSVSAKEAEHLFAGIPIENTIIALEIEGEVAPVPSLVREIQVHPFKPQIIHVDFYRVRAGEMLDVQIPVHLIGTPVGVRISGGLLQQAVHELMVRCLPTRIPSEIRADVSELDVGQSLHVADLPVEEGVEVLAEGDLTICSVALLRAGEADEADGAGEAGAAEGA